MSHARMFLKSSLHLVSYGHDDELRGELRADLEPGVHRILTALFGRLLGRPSKRSKAWTLRCTHSGACDRSKACPSRSRCSGWHGLSAYHCKGNKRDGDGASNALDWTTHVVIVADAESLMRETRRHMKASHRVGTRGPRSLVVATLRLDNFNGTSRPATPIVRHQILRGLSISLYKEFMDDAKHLEQILTKLKKHPSTAADLASSLGLSKGEISRSLDVLDADDKIVKFADRDEWVLLLDAVPGP